MPSKVEQILLAAISERQELVQQLWFYGFEVEALGHYSELKSLRYRLREVRDAHTRPNHPGAAGHSQTE
jgi:hypothetical protein